MNAAVQLSFEASGLDPVELAELAELPIFDRADLYERLELSREQREVVEQAVRAVKRGEYLRGRR